MATRQDLEAAGAFIGAEFANADMADISPLAQKLRIKPGMTVVVAGAAPEGVENAFNPLPEGATMTREDAPDRGMTLWFVQTQADLDAKADAMIPFMEGKMFWLIWPKNAKDDLKRDGLRVWFAKKGVSDLLVAALDANWACMWLKKRPANWKPDTESGFGPKKK